jgi:esterase/lipase superfamily enzyme
MLFPILLCAIAGMAGCASRSDDGQLNPVLPSGPVSKRQAVLVATTRLPGDSPTAFTFGRSHLISYQHVELSIPPNHKAGEIELPWPGPGSTETSFAALRNDRIPEQDFLTLASSKAAAGGGEVTVFVHGFNTTHEQAILRLGQIVVDAGALGAAVAFTWPSRGRVLDYLTDRESATFSRDRLELVLRGLARQPGIKRINVLAHSMGAFLTMETLRQAKLRGDGEFGNKLNAVVLAAPDIDLDVFRTQLEVIGRRLPPTVLIISSDDRALSFSRFLSGGVERVGVVEVESPEAQAEIARLGLLVIDLTKVKAGDTTGHDKFATAPRIISHIGGLLDGRRTLTSGVILNFNPDLTVSREANR